MVMFGIANGPLAWATYIFRNSLVFHDVDKMTSVYIHVLPLFLTYGLVLDQSLSLTVTVSASSSSFISSKIIVQAQIMCDIKLSRSERHKCTNICP